MRIEKKGVKIGQKAGVSPITLMSSSLPPRPSSANVDEGLLFTHAQQRECRPEAGDSDMFRDGANPDSMDMNDVLCDFCHAVWKEDIPMIEGHRGSCICGKCLRMAWGVVVVNKMNDSSGEATCRMCLQEREDPCYQSPAYEDALICRRCIRMSAHTLQMDDDGEWEMPDRKGGGQE